MNTLEGSCIMKNLKFTILIINALLVNVAYGGNSTVEEIRSKIKSHIDYKVGTEVDFTISQDQAVRLVCGDNPYNLKEILFGRIGDFIYSYTVRSDGGISGGGVRVKKLKFYRTFRGAPNLAHVCNWQVNDRGLSVTFSTVEDAEPLHTKKLPEIQRIAGFVKLWSMVKYNFANFDLVPELNWDNVLIEYLPKVMADQSNGEYCLLLRGCIARLKDGHTSVGVKGGTGLPIACPPLGIRSVGNKAIITELAETEEIKASAIKAGDEITHVDGRDVQEVLEKDIYPYIAASTDQGRDLKAYPRILHGPKESKVSLSIKTLEGMTHKVSLTRKTMGIAMIPRQRRGSIFEYRELKDGFVYVAINGFSSDDVVKAFNEKFEEISNAKGLIIDVRKNGGGSSFNGDAIIRRLIEKAIPHTLWKTPQHVASFEAWGRPKKWFEGEPRKIEPSKEEKYLGPIAILIGPETFSAAEDFVVPLHAAGRATIVGQKSGGSTGQPLRFSFLDGKVSGRICTKRDTYPDGREFVGVGIIPDVEVNPTVADVVSGRDVVLEKGIDILRGR